MIHLSPYPAWQPETWLRLLLASLQRQCPTVALCHPLSVINDALPRLLLSLLALPGEVATATAARGFGSDYIY